MESSATVAEFTGADVTPPHRSLPDEIVVWEILVRLPPKSLLRRRVVRCSWRRTTSTRDFLLAHHGRQPTLPLICGYHKSGVDIVPFDHRAADKLQPVARLDDSLFNLEASCDGLLILTDRNNRFSICNPATRQFAPLRQLDDFRQLDEFKLLGMYRHSPTGEYRLIGRLGTSDEDDTYVFFFTLGSSQPPWHIVRPDARGRICSAPVLLHGSLHWYVGHMIMVFDTTAESFRQMRSPVVPGDADLFEGGGMLGMSIFNETATIVDIWMMQDYEGEVWALKYRVELPVAELTAQFGAYQEEWIVVIPSWNGEAFGLVKFGEWLLHIDIDGKLVASFHQDELIGLTPFWLKQTLVPHSFFPTLEGYVVNGSPFISRLLSS